MGNPGLEMLQYKANTFSKQPEAIGMICVLKLFA